MARRGENIRKRKDGRWEGRYISERDAEGRAIYKSLYGKTYHDVRLKLLAAQKPVEKTHNMTTEVLFGEVLERWLVINKIKLKGATAYKYRYMLDSHILPKLGNVSISRLSSVLINEFLDEKLKNGRLDGRGGLSAAYVRSMQLMIQSAIHYAEEEGLCGPKRIHVFSPQDLSKELRVLSKAEQERLETYIFENLDFWKLGILISLYTGLRIGETCALSWKDVDFENEIIYVRFTVARMKTEGRSSSFVLDKPKTKTSFRKVPISSKLMPALQAMYEKAGGDYILSDKTSFLSPRTYEYRYHQLLKECGIPDINYHGLRHTFATRCIEAGVDVKSLSEILGHANVNITLNTYVHSSMELKRTQLEKLAVG